MKNLRDSLPSWIDSDRAAAVGSLKVCFNSWSNSFNFCLTNHKLLSLWTNIQSYLTHPFSTQHLYDNEKANNRNFKSLCRPQPIPVNWCSFSNSFMSNKKLEQLLLLSSQNTFPNMYKTLQLETTDLWMPFQRSSQCEQDIPSSVAKKISLFQQVRTLGVNQTSK